MEQLTLFNAVCHGSTWKELAQFVFNKLKQHNVPFEKLASVATDGAKNIIGSDNGMVSCLKRLVKQEMGPNSSSFKSAWCLAHRLNLVITDFERVPFINSVFISQDGSHQK